MIFSCAAKSSSSPIGALGIWIFERLELPAILARRSTSRTFSRYPSRMALSSLPSSPFSLLVRSRIRSRMLFFWRAIAMRSCGVSPSPNNIRKTLRGLYSIGSGVCSSRKDSVVNGPPLPAATWTVVSEASSREGNCVSWLMNFVITWSSVVDMLLPLRNGGAQPGGWIANVHRTGRGGVLQIAEGGHLLLERLQRRGDLIQLEAGARARRSPAIPLRAVLGVEHDGAMRNVKEAGADLGIRRRLREGRGCGHHRAQERKRQVDTRSLQDGSPGNVLLGDEHVRFLLLSNPHDLLLHFITFFTSGQLRLRCLGRRRLG